MTQNTPVKDNGKRSFRLSIQLQGKKRSLGFNQAFALAHRYARRDENSAATHVLALLNQAEPSDVPVRLLLARGYARTGQFAECKTCLDETFGEEHKELAAQLHDAFVLRAFGANEGAYQKLLDLAQHHPELPSVCLILGDLWERIGRIDKVQQLWKLASRRATQSLHVKHSVKVQLEDLRRSQEDDNASGVSTESAQRDSKSATQIGQVDSSVSTGVAGES